MDKKAERSHTRVDISRNDIEKEYKEIMSLVYEDYGIDPLNCVAYSVEPEIEDTMDLEYLMQKIESLQAKVSFESFHEDDDAGE